MSQLVLSPGRGAMSAACLALLIAALVWAVSAQSPTCQLQSGGDCVCGDPNVHSYCGTSSCPPEDRLVNNPSDYCRTFSRFQRGHIYPDEWELLFDSDDYRSDILGSVFLEREFDSDSSTLSAVSLSVTMTKMQSFTIFKDST